MVEVTERPLVASNVAHAPVSAPALEASPSARAPAFHTPYFTSGREKRAFAGVHTRFSPLAAAIIAACPYS